MNRIDTPSQNMMQIPDHASLPKPVTARRLIVLVPANVDCKDINHRIWKLANETYSSVLLLALYKDPYQEPTLRRELITMSALIQDAKVSVEIRIEKGTNWVNAVQHTVRSGDMLVCIAEQSVGIKHRPLSQILESDLDTPVYILSELVPVKTQSTWLTRLTAWSGFAAILIGFFVLQVKIMQLPKDLSQTIILLVLLIPEFWLLWVWNSLFS